MNGMTAPPGAVRVILLLARTALRRRMNRMGSAFRRKKEAAPGAPRTGTAQKGGSGLGVAFLGLLFLFYGFSLSWRFLDRLGESLENHVASGAIPVPEVVYARLAELVKEQAVGGLTGEGRRRLLAEFESLGSSGSHFRAQTQEQRTARAERWLAAFGEKGLSGFRVVPESETNSSSWTEAGRRPAGLRAIGLFLFLLAASQFWLGLGTGNQDLGKVEWSVEWLFTFPAPAGRLFLAKMLESAVINPMGWIVMFPFLTTIFWSSGAGAASLPLGAAAMLFTTLLLASTRVTVETWLRMRLSLDRLKNVQALCTVVGTLLWLFILWIALAHPTPAAFLEAVPRIPGAVLWNPLSLPVLLCEPGPTAWMTAGGMAALTLLVPLASVGLCTRLVRDGLLTTSGTFQGTRRGPGAASAPGRKTFFRGVLAKDLRLLLRDRNFLVTTLVVPVILFGFQVMLNPSLVRGVTGDFRHAATLAYGLGAYILMSSAFQVLTVEGGALWLLYTFPHELHRILVQKTLIWAGLAVLYAGVVLGVVAGLSRELEWEAVSLAATAAVGVVLSAFIAGALGALASDPLQSEPQRKIRPQIVYLYMFLSSMYGYAIYGPSAWTRVVQVILSSLLALALWQKVRDRLPYLLDPTEMPPPSVALSDGLVATLAFFVIQGLISLMGISAGLPPAPTILVAYVSAGALVTLFTLYGFWRIRVPRLLFAVGLRSSRGSFLRSLGIGTAAGSAAAGFGLFYLKLIDRIEPLREMKQQAQELTRGLSRSGFAWIAVLAIGAAPLFEEYLFRGLVFKGMRRSMKPALAILASAAIFAIVHPPISFVPVFGLGIAAALAFEGSGGLLAPILTHALYNAAVVLLGR